jgi:3-oxoacyl-[acyl-carrier protein] reductase
MELGLEGRVAIVGGGSRGLGRAIAYELAQEGVSTTIFARNEDALVVAETVEKFGRLDILINNAGGPPIGLFETFADAAWEQAVQLTLMSTVRLTRAAVPHMRAQHWGRVLNLVSYTVREPAPGLLLSNSVRMAVVGLAKTLADELAPDILVNNVAPGRILTDRLRYLNEQRARETGEDIDEVEQKMTAEISLRRYGTPREFASMVAFLASERASYITGQTFLCDGGLVSAP